MSIGWSCARLSGFACVILFFSFHHPLQTFGLSLDIYFLNYFSQHIHIREKVQCSHINIFAYNILFQYILKFLSEVPVVYNI